MRRRILSSSLPLLILIASGGCGSKITEANFYRVQHGMTEQDVEELLGPAHAESAGSEAGSGAGPEAGNSTRPVERKVKSWTRGGLIIRVEFAGGAVVWRGAGGIPAESTAPATRPAAPALGNSEPVTSHRLILPRPPEGFAYGRGDARYL